MPNEERKMYERYVAETSTAQIAARRIPITPRTTFRRGAVIAAVAGALIAACILGVGRINSTAHARNIRKYSAKRLECPLCRNVSYSTEYDLIDLPEEVNKKKWVTCPKCHEQVSYFDLEEANEEP